MTPDIPTIRPHTPPPMPEDDLRRSVEDALDALGRPESLTIIVNDPQRRTATDRLLALIAALVPLSRCRVLVATGTHRIAPPERRRFERRLLGRARTAEIDWHDCRSDQLVELAGRPSWRGHAWLAEPTPILAVGSVEPHYFAGYTGAHKTCTIGCASFDDIQANHAAAMTDDCAPCKLQGNPVYEGVVRMLDFLSPPGPDARRLAAVNVIQTGDTIVSASAGDPLAALEAATPMVDRIYRHSIAEPADIIIAQVSGPLARSFYQAEKAIKNNESAVRDGGAIVLSAACDDGIGQPAFTDLLREAGTYRRALAVVAERGYRLSDHKAVRLRRLTDPSSRAVRLFAVAEGLSAADAGLLGLTKVRDEAAALAAAAEPGRHRILRVADAANMVVTCGGDRDGKLKAEN